MAMKETTKAILEYIIANQDKDFTAEDVAKATGTTTRQVNGVMTMTIQKRAEKKYGYREEVKINTPDGEKTVKFLRLNEEGKKHDFFAEPVKETAEA
jgi:hypothetical protein